MRRSLHTAFNQEGSVLATQTVDDRPDLFSIKVELFEQKLEDTDPQEGLKISKEEESLSTDSMFGKEWSINLWKDGELAAMKEEEAPLQPVINEEATQTVDDRPDLFSIKVELFEQKLEDTDPQEGLKISSCFESESDSTERQYIKESYPQPAPTEIMEEPYARATSAGGRLEQDTLPITLEGTAESHASPAPPQSTAESGDAQPCFLRGQNINPAKGPEGAGRQLLACRYCGRNFSYFISFQKHQQTCYNTSENHSCQKTELAHHESTEIGQKTFKNRWFSCEHCTETFSCSYDLETHQTIHREKQFSCNDCGKCYLEKWRLDSHLCSRTGGKPYKCNDCGNSFSQEVHLSLHQCLHNKVKQYSCVKSGENSSRKRKLESQHRIYREGNFYSCAVCQKSFTNINTFTQYLCKHITDKSHRCLECGKCFTERSSLLLHQRTIHAGEKPHSCAECGKNFTQKANLQKHQVIHSGEKPYKCLECGKRFTQKGYLKKHDQIHRGVKPYRCRECGKCFYLKTDLNCHERNHRTQVL
ncbi:zinc finger protein 883-like isoform X2 [Conger conger]|uniref:zinc finger protein 883-like isoform X2 n=1 Tax=Conger conger TaxID=82655 RepID=UPI002A5994E5|nr:zinc finger protein 883-like isoform X2 [Conger conger]